jgi:hypothetical protein
VVENAGETLFKGDGDPKSRTAVGQIISGS